MLEERKEGMFMNVWLLTNALGHKSYRRILEKKMKFEEMLLNMAASLRQLHV